MAFTRTALLLVGTLALAQAAAAQQNPTLPIPIRAERLVSAKVGETREFWVSVPDGYNESTEKFPVIYMMDGEMNFNSGLIGGLRHAAQLGEMPEFIIVGIRNTDRGKDTFPEEMTFGDGTKDGGRANQYLDFLREELMPHIAAAYRVTDYRVLYGTSSTGFTAVHALFRNPDLANAYVAVSATLAVPSFQSTRNALIGAYKGGKRHLVLVMGEHDYPTVVSLNGALKEKIGQLSPPGLSCRLRVLANAGHVPADALVEGLRSLFQGWKITEPLTAANFNETRAQVDRRLEKFGVRGNLAEETLRDLGKGLLGEKKMAKALEVLEYRAACYPRSADAQVDLGDAHRQNGKVDQAKTSYERALALAPGHAGATAKLKELAQTPKN